MDILLYKDGHLSISESPLQGKENNLDDVVMLVSNPQEVDTLTYNGGKWVNGAGGSGGGGLAIHVSTEQSGANTIYTLDKTWQEITDALMSGQYVALIYTESNGSINAYPVVWVQDNSGNYVVNFGYDAAPTSEYEASSADGYPSHSEGK